MKKKLTFWLSLLGLVAFGGMIGFFIGMLSETNDFRDFDPKHWYIWFPFDIVYLALIATCFILVLLVIVNLVKANTLKNIVKEDELFSAKEKALSSAMVQATLLDTFSLILLFSILPGIFLFDDTETNTLILATMFISAVLFTFLSFILLRQSIKVHNQLDPKKTVDLYDSKASKNYIDKLDESEKLQTYKASYDAMVTTSIVMKGIISFLGFYSLFFDMQIVAILIVGLLLVIMNSTYFVAAKKYMNVK